MAKYINGKEITATAFAFDGCHKIYLLDESQYDEYKALDYTLYDIDELPRAWADTCPLRFIDSGDLSESIVSQFEPATFEGWEIDEGLQWELDEMALEQRIANGEE